MRLTRATTYALHALDYMARHPERQLFPSQAMARDLKIPEFFIVKALTPLVQRGLLMSLRGPRGGFALARPPKQISMLEVVEAVEGAIHGDMALGTSKGAVNRRLQKLLDEVAGTVRRRLAKVSIADLASAR